MAKKMKVKKVKVVPNSSEIASFLKTDPGIAKELEEKAKLIEKEIPGKIHDSNSQLGRDSKKSTDDETGKRNSKLTYIQKISSEMPKQVIKDEVAPPTDRQRHFVEIENMHPEDFMFGTLQKAVESAAKKNRKKKRSL